METKSKRERGIPETIDECLEKNDCAMKMIRLSETVNVWGKILLWLWIISCAISIIAIGSSPDIDEGTMFIIIGIALVTVIVGALFEQFIFKVLSSALEGYAYIIQNTTKTSRLMTLVADRFEDKNSSNFDITTKESVSISTEINTTSEAKADTEKMECLVCHTMVSGSICPNCGTNVDAYYKNQKGKFKECPICHTKQQSDRRFCIKCDHSFYD